MESNLQRILFDKTFLNIVTHLESFQEVSSVVLQAENGILSHEPVVWQKKHDVKLPQDVKAFYELFNGFSLEWKVDIAGKNISIGLLSINRLNMVTPILIEGEQISTNGAFKPPNPLTCKAFVIDSSCEVGVIVLVFRSSVNTDKSFEDSEIWLQDISCRWHYICQTFTQYIRLMLVHLGIFGWQMVYTPDGIPALTQQWMNMFCKERLLADLHEAKIQA